MSTHTQVTKDELRQQFASELTESVISDVFTEAQNNVQQAHAALLSLVSQEPSPEAIQRYLRELDNFQILGQDVILRSLAENKWDVDKTLVTLVALTEEKQKEDGRKKREKERELILIKERERASAFMEQFFPKIPKSRIDQLLDENDGDVNATVEMIINMEDERERKTREEERIRRDRTEKCHGVAIRFNKSPQEVEQLLSAQNWDIATVVNQLVKAEQDVKYQRMIQLYNHRRPEEIRHALETNNYDEIKTRKFIDDKIERETVEAERRARELRERKETERKRIEDIQQKQIEELKKLQQINQQKAKEAEIKLLEERRLLQIQQEEAERQRLENEKREREAQLAREKEEEARTFAARHEALLHRSVVLADQIQLEVDELDPHNLLKIAIEKKLRGGDQVGPTFPSLLPIEMQFNSEVPVMQDFHPPIERHDISESPVSTSHNTSSTLQRDHLLVQLEAYPLRVDYGETITLNYEFTQEPANSYNWIGLYKEGAQCKEYEKYEWAPTQKGSITFTAPSYTGRFFFRFLFNKTYICWGTSNFIEVGPKFKMTPTLSQNQVTLKVEQSSGQPCPYAWVAMYESNKDNRSYYTYSYLQGAPPTQVAFKIPKVGVWEFRLFPQRSYSTAADTCQVEFKGNDSLSMEVDTPNNLVVISHTIVSVDPYYDNVWVGIYQTNETDIRQYRRYKKVATDSGKVMVKAIQTPGTYEARLFASGSPNIITKSNTIVVTPKIK